MLKAYRYDGSREFRLSKVSTDETSMEQDRKRAEKRMEENFARILELQGRLYAEKKEGLIILFQAVQQVRAPAFIQFRQCLIQQQQGSRPGMFPHPFDLSQLQ